MKINLQKNKTFFLLFFIFSFFSFYSIAKPADTFNYSSFLPVTNNSNFINAISYYNPADFSGQNFPLITEDIPCVDINHNIGPGSRDYVVFGPILKLQMYLYQNEYMKYPPTGLYLQYTYDGVRNFQRDNRLKETGLVDINTRAVLKQITCQTKNNIITQVVNPAPVLPQSPIISLPNPNPTSSFYCSLNNTYYNSQADLNYFCINNNNQASYTITFDGTGGLNGIAVTSPSSVVVMNSQAITLPSMSPINGYIFDGWSTPNTIQCITTPCPSNSIIYQAGTSYIPNSNITLSAVWIQNANMTYTIDYAPNGADSGSPSINTQSVNIGGSLTTASQGSLVKSGFTFAGWSTSPSGTPLISANSSYTPTSDITLYAVWNSSGSTAPVRQNNLISLSLDNYGNIIATSQYPVATQLIIPISYSTYSTSGIGTSCSTGLTYTLTILANSSKSINGTPPNISNCTISGIGTITYINPSSDNTYNYIQANNTPAPTPTINYYTITFNNNGGTGAPLAQTVQVGSSIMLSTGVPYRSGFTFIGWSTYQYSVSGSIYPGTSYFPNGNTTLYAIWR